MNVSPFEKGHVEIRPNHIKKKKSPRERFQEIAGVYSGGATPVPIPNTEVKSSCADGTVPLGTEE